MREIEDREVTEEATTPRVEMEETGARHDEPDLVDERRAARKRVERRRKFWGDLVAYIAVNTFLVVVWAMTDRGYFWPGWVLAGWGLALALDGWNAFFRRPITAADVDAEMARRR